MKAGQEMIMNLSWNIKCYIQRILKIKYYRRRYDLCRDCRREGKLVICDSERGWTNSHL